MVLAGVCNLDSSPYHREPLLLVTPLGDPAYKRRRGTDKKLNVNNGPTEASRQQFLWTRDKALDQRQHPGLNKAPESSKAEDQRQAPRPGMLHEVSWSLFVVLADPIYCYLM